MTNDPTPAAKPTSPDEFYVGYAPPMPLGIARFVTRVVVSASAGAVAAAGLLAIGHVRLEGGSFAFGERYPVAGVIVERPYPAIRPDAGNTWMLLVAPGKHGADALVRGLDGAHVTMTGARIQRDGQVMLEMAPGSLSSRAGRTTVGSGEAHASRVTLRGEIVDSKCFLGAMVPGAGKTHRECGSLCLRGGIPPALFVRDRDGHETLLLLETERGEAIGARAVELAGRSVEITGMRAERGGWPTLQSDPTAWRVLRSTQAAQAEQ